MFNLFKSSQKHGDNDTIFDPEYLLKYWKITMGADEDSGTLNQINVFDYVQLKPYPFLKQEYGGCTSSLLTDDKNKLYVYVLSIDKKIIDQNKVVPLYDNIDMRVAYINNVGKISVCCCDSRLFQIVKNCNASLILQEFVNDNSDYNNGSFKPLVSRSMIRPRKNTELRSHGTLGKFSSFKSEVFYPQLLVLNVKTLNQQKDKLVIDLNDSQQKLRIQSVTLVGMLPSGKLEEVTVERDLICEL